jgi:hypothetical protein
MRKTRKLALRAETLRLLSAGALRTIRGALTPPGPNTNPAPRPPRPLTMIPCSPWPDPPPPDPPPGGDDTDVCGTFTTGGTTITF